MMVHTERQITPQDLWRMALERGFGDIAPKLVHALTTYGAAKIHFDGERFVVTSIPEMHKA